MGHARVVTGVLVLTALPPSPWQPVKPTTAHYLFSHAQDVVGGNAALHRINSNRFYTRPVARGRQARLRFHDRCSGAFHLPAYYHEASRRRPWHGSPARRCSHGPLSLSTGRDFLPIIERREIVYLDHRRLRLSWHFPLLRSRAWLRRTVPQPLWAGQASASITRHPNARLCQAVANR